MTYTSRPAVVVLSRGSTWNPRPFDPPETLPNDVVGFAWPAGATVQTVFYDSAGGVLAVVTGTVAPAGMTLGPAAPSVVDVIPNGANFEVVMTVAGAPYQIRYGKVIRREATFPLSTVPAGTGQVFFDSWPTLGIRSSWVVMAGTTVVHNNSGISQLNGIGSPNTGAQSDNALRWFQPLDGDSATVKIVGLNLHSYTVGAFAKMRIIVCSDVAMSSYLFAELSGTNPAGTHVDQLRFGTGTAPTAVSYVGSPTTHTLVNQESITVRYDTGSDTLSAYSGTNLTPLATFPATGIPHGPGHRYLALAWSTSPTSDGLQITNWNASDEL